MAREIPLEGRGRQDCYREVYGDYMIEPINLYNVDYAFEKATWIDVRDLKSDTERLCRVSDRGGDGKGLREAPGTTMKDSVVVLT
jgi:hypothetical protein